MVMVEITETLRRDILQRFNRKFWHERKTASFLRGKHHILTCMIDYQDAFDFLKGVLDELKLREGKNGHSRSNDT